MPRVPEDGRGGRPMSPRGHASARPRGPRLTTAAIVSLQPSHGVIAVLCLTIEDRTAPPSVNNGAQHAWPEGWDADCPGATDVPTF